MSANKQHGTQPNVLCESIQGRFISWHATSAIASSYALLPTEHLLGRHLRPPLLFLPPMFRPRKMSAHHVPLERTHRKAWLPCWGAKAAAEVAQRAARARESLTMVGVGCSLSTKECALPPDASWLTKISHGLQTTSQTSGTRSLEKVKDMPLVVYSLGSVEKALRGRPEKIPTSTHRH